MTGLLEDLVYKIYIERKKKELKKRGLTFSYIFKKNITGKNWEHEVGQRKG